MTSIDLPWTNTLLLVLGEDTESVIKNNESSQRWKVRNKVIISLSFQLRKHL